MIEKEINFRYKKLEGADGLSALLTTIKILLFTTVTSGGKTIESMDDLKEYFSSQKTDEDFLNTIFLACLTYDFEPKEYKLFCSLIEVADGLNKGVLISDIRLTPDQVLRHFCKLIKHIIDEIDPDKLFF